MLLIALMFVLGVCVTAREAGVYVNITAGVLSLCTLFHGYKTKKLDRGAAALLFAVLICGCMRYHLMRTTIDEGQKKIAAFNDMKVVLTGVVDSHSSSAKSDKLVIKDAVLSSAYGDINSLPADASDKMRARYNQEVGDIVAYISKDKGTASGTVASDTYSSRGPYPGELVSIHGKMLPAEPPRNEGQFDFELYYRTIGVSGSMYGDRVTVIGGEPEPFRAMLQKLRTDICRQLDIIAEEMDAGIYKALLVGDKSFMDESIRELYQNNGIAHILAVSGLHLAIIGAGFHKILRRYGATKATAGAASAILVLSFGIFTGSSGSAMRAVIMLLIKFLGETIGRSYDMLTAMALAGIMLLIHEPYMIFASGFQLSFTAVFALGIGGELPRPRSNILNGMYMSMILQITTLPVILYHYFRFPLYGILLNLVVLPLMSYVIYSGLLAVALSFASLMLGIAAIGFGHYILRFYTYLCSIMSRIPYASLLLGRPGILNIILYYVLLSGLTFLILYLKKLRKRRMLPARLEWLYLELPKIAVLIVLLSIFILIPKKPTGLEITTIDVGQGDGFVIREGDMIITIDGGSTSDKKFPEDMLVPYLESQAIDTIDMSFITHCDSDHYSGILYLMEEDEDIFIRELYLPFPAEGDERYDMLRNAAAKRGTEVHYFGFGQSVETGKLSLTGLYPVERGYMPDANSHSQGILLTYGDFSMLFTGDMDKECEYKMLSAMQESGWTDYHIDVLKAGHHGSSTSTSKELLDAMKPGYAILSYGKNNDYGHPHDATLNILREHNVEMLKTGILHEIRLVSDGREYYFTYPVKRNSILKV